MSKRTPRALALSIAALAAFAPSPAHADWLNDLVDCASDPEVCAEEVVAGTEDGVEDAIEDAVETLEDAVEDAQDCLADPATCGEEAAAQAEACVNGVTYPACFQDIQGRALGRYRVSWLNWADYNESITGEDGCVEVTVNDCTGYGVDVAIFAQNPAVRMTGSSLLYSFQIAHFESTSPSTVTIQDSVVSTDEDDDADGVAEAHEQADIFVLAENIRRTYNDGLRDFATWGGEFPLSSDWDSPEFVHATFPSTEYIVGFTVPYVEAYYPLTGFPRIHLFEDNTDRDGDGLMSGYHTSREVSAHEFSHGLHFSMLSVEKRIQAEAEYAYHLADHFIDTGTGATHTLSARTTELVAWLEAFGAFGQAYATQTTAGLPIDQRRDELATWAAGESWFNDVSGSDMEGAVFRAIYLDFAEDVGLEYAVQSVVDSDALNIYEYGEYVLETEGWGSPVAQALIDAGLNVGIAAYRDWCSPERPCPAAQGDCNTDSDCGDELVCHHNVGADYGLSDAADVCGPPLGDWDYCDEMVCHEGDGDCDDDSQCPDGRCADNIGADFGFSSRVDVCLDTGHGDYCSLFAPCGAYEGDCDSDYDCSASSWCVDNVGADYGFEAWVDVCVPLEMADSYYELFSS